MADYAEGKGDPPPELLLARNCRSWHTLPHDGGYLDQPAGLMRLLQTCENVYDAFTGMNKAEDKVKWQVDNPEHWETVQAVWEMRRG